jgi:hypothetical protein
MTLNPLHAAAYAGQLAGAACEAMFELLLPRDEPARALDDDLDFDEVAAERYLEHDARDRGLPRGHQIDYSVFDEPYTDGGSPYSLPITLQPGDLASVQLPDGQLITGVWNPAIEGSLDTDPARVAAARAAQEPKPVGTVKSGLIEERFPLTSPTAARPLAAVQGTCPAPPTEADGAGQPTWRIVEPDDLHDAAVFLYRYAPFCSFDEVDEVRSLAARLGEYAQVLYRNQ